MINHVMLGTNDIDRAKRFYDAVLGVLGAGEPIRNVAGSGHVRLFYRHDGSSFCLTQPINNEPATVANGGTIGFKMASHEQAKAWHDAGVAAGPLHRFAGLPFEATFALLSQRRFHLKEGGVAVVFVGVGILLTIVQGGMVRPVPKSLGASRTLEVGLLLNGIGLVVEVLEIRKGEAVAVPVPSSF